MLRCFSRALEFNQRNNNQYHAIYIYFHIISLETATKILCFNIESAHNYSKYLSRKQKFINWSVSLARRHQNMECRNFINNQLKLDPNLLFITWKKLIN